MKSNQFVLILFMICVSSHAQQNEVILNHYLFPEFTNGTVLKKTGIRQNALLNYNAVTEEMIFDDHGHRLAIADNEITLIDTVFIKDRKFIVLNGKFVEYLTHLNWELYVEYKCRVREPGKPAAYGGTSHTSAADSYSSFVSGGAIYDLKLPDDFEVDPYVHYWLGKKGELTSFMNMRQLRKLYEGQEDLFKAYVKEHDTDYDDKEGIFQLVEYLESNRGL